MQARRKLAPGQKGTKKFLARYGDQLVCVRYRYDEQRRKRFTTVEIIVEEADWVPPSRPDKAALVGVRIGLRETDLQRRARQAGGKWNPAKQVWEMRYDQALAQGLKERIVDAEGV